MSKLYSDTESFRESRQGLAALTTEQIKEACSKAGMGAALHSHGNCYNQIRAGDINGAVGTMKAGCSARSHKDARRLLRKALRAYVPTL